MKDRRWRRGFPDDDDLFGPIWSDFDRMRRQMDEMFKQAMKGMDENSEGRSYVYGFNVRVGPDGVPRVQEFGNVRPRRMMKDAIKEGKTPSLDQREPLTDVIDCDDSYCVTMELPGVDKSDIEMTVDGEELVISVDTEERKYRKVIDLPDDVDADLPKATYKNGILDIAFQKVSQKKKKARRVTIE